MVTVDRWTGREARALRLAKRMSLQAFAAHLGVTARQISTWESRGETIAIREVNQAALDTSLGASSADVHERFVCLTARQPAISKREFGETSVGQLVAAAGAAVSRTASSNDHVFVACVTSDGRMVHVPLPRRAVLAGIAGAALGAQATSPGGPGPSPSADNAIFGDSSAVDTFRRLRDLLVNQDNIVGPAHILPAVEHHIGAIKRLRLTAAAADNKALLGLQAEYAEFAGWLAQDMSDFHNADRWLSLALAWAHSTGDSKMVTYILARKSQLAGDMADPENAIDMAEAAQEASASQGRLAAVSYTYAALGHALAGHHQNVDRAIKTAHERLHDADDDAAGHQWAPWLDTAYIDVQAGRCLAQLGRHEQAVDAYQKALNSLPSTYRRDRGLYLARQARAHAEQGDFTRAASVGIGAASIALTTSSRRTISELAHVHRTLAGQPQTATGDEFSQVVHTLIRTAV